MLGILRMRWLLTLLPRTISYLFNEQIPFFYKLLLLIPVFWQFTPVARLSYALPVLGLLDEFTIILLTMALFTYLVGRYLQRKNPRKDEVTAPLETIEGEYYVIDRKESSKTGK